VELWPEGGVVRLRFVASRTSVCSEFVETGEE
jgi:hypothetical protein